MSAAVSDNGAGQPARGQPIRGRTALGSLTARSRTTGEQALARSRFVRRLRIALPILALVLVAAFFFNTQSNTVDEAFLEDFKDMSAAAEELKMANPRFAGIDDEGKPFEITADAAKQIPGGENMVELDLPRAVQGDGDEQTVVTAEKGLYESETNMLELRDGVTLSHNIGADVYVLRSPAATISIQEEIVTSDAGVGGQGTDGGQLQADSMKAYNAEGRVVFEGNVYMRIYPKSDRSQSDNDDGNAPNQKDVEITDPQ